MRLLRQQHFRVVLLFGCVRGSSVVGILLWLRQFPNDEFIVSKQMAVQGRNGTTDIIEYVYRGEDILENTMIRSGNVVASCFLWFGR